MRMRLLIVAGLITLAWLPAVHAGEVSRETSRPTLQKSPRPVADGLLVAQSPDHQADSPASPAKAKGARSRDSKKQPAQLVPGAWWDDRTCGWIGGIGGAVLGCLGGLIGVLAGCGRARAFVMALTAALVFFGVVMLGVGVVALLFGQPWGVWYPLLLCGFIVTVVIGFQRPLLRRRYEQMELQKMSAMDLGKQSD